MNPHTGEHPEPDEHLLEQEDELAEADADRQWMPDTDRSTVTLPDPGVTTPPTDEQRTYGSGTDGAHRVEWHDGQAKFICDSPADSNCRMWCTSCDESCRLVEEDGTRHVWEPTGSCRVMDWLDAAGAQETFLDEDEWDGLPENNAAIDTEWDGDNYLWSYRVTHVDQLELTAEASK